MNVVVPCDACGILIQADRLAKVCQLEPGVEVSVVLSNHAEG